MKLILYFVIISTSLTNQLCDCQFFRDTDSTELYEGDDCNPKLFNTKIGVCKLIKDCVAVQQNLRNRIYNHTVCSFFRMDQIVCCPIYKSENLEQNVLISLNETKEIDGRSIGSTVAPITTLSTLIPSTFGQSTIEPSTPIPNKPGIIEEFEECLVERTNERGVLRFPQHCPDLVVDTTHPRICQFEVCKDLVCCPIQNQTNPKKSKFFQPQSCNKLYQL